MLQSICSVRMMNILKLNEKKTDEYIEIEWKKKQSNAMPNDRKIHTSSNTTVDSKIKQC